MTIKQKTGAFIEQAGLCVTTLFYVLFGWQQWWSGVSPRLLRGSPERDSLHHAHLSLGATLFVLSILCLLVWLLRPGSSALQKFKKAFSNSATTAVSLFFISIVCAMVFGLAQAWAKGEKTAVFGVFPLPHFLDWDWGTSGYMHSAMSSIGSALFAGMVFVFLFIQLKKYIKPGYAVAILLLLHVVVNLPKPPSLHPIAAFGTYVMVPSYYLTALAVYCWANNRKFVYWPVYLFFMLFFLYLPYFAFKVLPPWHVKPAADIVLVEPTDQLSEIRSREEIFPTEESFAAAKLAVGWCTQCHNVVENEAHLLGPNINGVVNRQAGTAAGYGRYSEAMIAAGLKGMFWTRENLAEFLTHGSTYIPGNLMNQQTDFSDPVKLNLAIDYLEYISAE